MSVTVQKPRVISRHAVDRVQHFFNATSATCVGVDFTDVANSEIGRMTTRNRNGYGNSIVYSVTAPHRRIDQSDPANKKYDDYEMFGL